MAQAHNRVHANIRKATKLMNTLVRQKVTTKEVTIAIKRLKILRSLGLELLSNEIFLEPTNETIEERTKSINKIHKQKKYQLQGKGDKEMLRQERNHTSQHLLKTDEMTINMSLKYPQHKQGEIEKIFSIDHMITETELVSDTTNCEKLFN